MRRKDRIAKKQGFFRPAEQQRHQEAAPEKHRAHEHGKKHGIYYKYYKQLMIIPFAILLLSIGIILYKYASTGDFINRGMTLKGGTSVTIIDGKLDPDTIRTELMAAYPSHDINVRTVEQGGVRSGLIIQSDVVPEDTAGTQDFLAKLRTLTGKTDRDFSIETMGSSLGSAFFQQTMVAMLVAFILMSLVVFLNFKSVVPSAAVILAVFSNTVMTVAVLNVIGAKMGTASIAALLMMIGYSVDTDILLSTRVLKSKVGTVYERIVGGIMTGFVMNATVITATFVAFMFAQSDVLRQITEVVLIGLFCDMLNTWVQNAGILRWYFEKRETS